MSHIKTKSGFEADIDEASLDDYRLLSALRDAELHPHRVVDVVRFVLGTEDEARLVQHLVDTTGKASIEDIRAEITSIFTQLNESKKK